jgi:hypothetical protein
MKKMLAVISAFCLLSMSNAFSQDNKDICLLVRGDDIGSSTQQMWHALIHTGMVSCAL